MSEYEYDATNDSVQADAVTQAMDAYKQARRDEEAAAARSQYINFGVLAGILVVVVLVVALAAPFISQRIVAAVMGEHLPKASAEMDAGNAVQEEMAPAAVEEVVPAGDVVEEAGMENTAVEAYPSAAGLETYTVQSGDTLYSVARQFEVNVTDIIAVNSISNPDNIPVGTVLTIPEANQ